MHSVLIHEVIFHGMDSVHHRIGDAIAFVINNNLHPNLIAPIGLAILVGEGFVAHEKRRSIFIYKRFKSNILRTILIEKVQALRPRQVIRTISLLHMIRNI
jgi:hypothetical protein